MGATGMRVRLGAVHPHNLFASLTDVEEGYSVFSLHNPRYGEKKKVEWN